MRVLFALAAAGLTAAAPSIVIPLAEQRPPVARVGTPYVFDLLPDTFRGENMTYTAADLPSWLHFSAAQSAFTGTPLPADVGSVNVTVSAHDASGTTNASVTLVVSSNPAPVVDLSFAQQIADPDVRQFSSVEPTPNGQAITVPTGWSFSLGWSSDTFSSDSRLYLSSYVRGSTSLPRWLSFSNTTFTFNGIAPASPGSYPIVVSASDIWGYSAAQTSFVLSVGNGDAVELNQELPTLNTMAFSKINYKIDTSRVTIGGRPARTTDFVVGADLANTPWLSFDNNTDTITGTVPTSWENGTVAPLTIPVVLASTNNSDTIITSTLLNLNIVPYYFTTNHLPNGTTTQLETFAYNIEPYLRNKGASINATVVPPEAAAWLVYYPENYTLVGTPPANISYNSIHVAFMGTQNGVSGEATMDMAIAGAVQPPKGEPTPVPQGSIEGGKKDNKKKIIIGVCVGVGGFLLLLLLLLLCCCRRRHVKRSKPVDEKMEETPTPRNSITGFEGRRNGRPATLKRADTRSPCKSTASETVAGTPNTLKSNLKASVADDSSPQRFNTIKGLFGNVDDAANTKEDLMSWTNLERAQNGARAVSVNSASTVVPEAPKTPVTPVDPVQPADPGMSRSPASGDSLGVDSLESWESPRSFHWSDEDQYLPPLMPSTTTFRSLGSPLTDEPRRRGGSTPRDGATTPTPLGSSPTRPQPLGFPGNRPQERHDDQDSEPLSRDVSTYSEFSELGQTRTVDNSFCDPGSLLGPGTGKRRFTDRHRSDPMTSHVEQDTDSDSSESGSSFHGPAGLSRFAVTLSPPSIVSASEPSIPTPRDTTPPRNPVRYEPVSAPLPVLAGPIMPSSRQPVHRRRASSSRRTTARIHATREHIVGPTTSVQPAEEQLAVVHTMDDPYVRH